MTPAPSDVTRILQDLSAGQGSTQERSEATERLLGLVYDELRRIASRMMSAERANHPLQPTALVHEAYLKLIGQESLAWNDKVHFMSIAARAMRQILVDQARRKGAVKRGGDRDRVDVDEVDIALDAPGDDIVALHEALEALEGEDARKAQVVTLRQFAGLTREETAAALGISVRTVDREWHYSIARLHQLIADAGDSRDG